QNNVWLLGSVGYAAIDVGEVLAIIRRKEVDLPCYQAGFDACWLLVYGLWQASSFFDFDYLKPHREAVDGPCPWLQLSAALVRGLSVPRLGDLHVPTGSRVNETDTVELRREHDSVHPRRGQDHLRQLADQGEGIRANHFAPARSATHGSSSFALQTTW